MLVVPISTKWALELSITSGILNFPPTSTSSPLDTITSFSFAINENTGALLKVHTSNFKILGFTESVSIKEICNLGKEKNIPVIEDIGSGVLVDLSKYGLEYEPTVQDSIKSGVDIVSSSFKYS